jgi:hypothetical protein
MSPPPDNRVDDLRQQLKSLGYLDAGVDRFVLGGASDRRGPLAIAARASLRVGLLGGALLGPAAALGLRARLPGLMRGAQDAVVIALYLAVFFFVAVASASFLVSVVSAAFARPGDQLAARAGRIARAAAWVLTLGTLLYLTLWWRNANAGFGWSAPWWTSFALVVAVAISLLLGHTARIATLAVIAARSHGAGLPPLSGRSWRVVVAGGVLALAGAASLLFATAVETPSRPEHPPLTVVSTGQALRVIAIDGFDAGLFDAFSVDLYSRFRGTKARLEPQDTSDPARAWTTIATGVPPAIHGVHAIESRRVAGVRGRFFTGPGPLVAAVSAATDLLRLTRPTIASRDERRAKTIWEVAEEAGLRTAIVNWWATWPAPPTGGIVLTDRALLRLDQGGALDAEIAPASLYEPLRDAWPSIRERARQAATQVRSDDAAVTAVLRRSAELDASVVGLYDALPGGQRDLEILYLPGLDIAQHALLGHDEAARGPSALATRVDALRGYHSFLRQLLDPLIRPGEKLDILLVTQPGRVATPAAGILASFHALDRFGDVQPGATTHASAGVADIAPTILSGLGIPLSRELTGRALPFLSDAGARYVESYGPPFAQPASGHGRPLDQETIDRLRSLGYIK